MPLKTFAKDPVPQDQAFFNTVTSGVQDQPGSLGSLVRQGQHSPPLIVAHAAPAGDLGDGALTPDANVGLVQRADAHARRALDIGLPGLPDLEVTADIMNVVRRACS